MIPESVFAPVIWRKLSDSTKLIYFELWGLATKCDTRGAFTFKVGTVPSIEDIAFELRRDQNIDEFNAHIQALIEGGMLANDETGIYITAFREANSRTQADRRRIWAEKKRGQRSFDSQEDSLDSQPDTQDSDSDTSSGSLADVPKDVQEESNALSLKNKELRVNLNLNPSGSSVGESGDSPPPPDSPPSKPKPKKSTADERSSHPAILAIFHVTGKMPHKDIYGPIIEALGQSPDEIKLKSCWEAWRIRNYSPTNYAWATEWYLQGIPAQRQGNSARASPNSPGPPETNGDGMTREQRLLAQTLAKVQAQNGEFP